MKLILIILQIVIASSLIVLILFQTKGTGLGSTFGQSQELYRTKRGMEKILYRLTILDAALFLVISLISILVK